MAKKDAAPAQDADDENPEADGEATEGAEPRKGFLKKLLSNKKLLIIAIAGLVLLLGGGVAGYFFLFNGSDGATQTAENKPHEPIVAPQVTFFDMPDIVVNIQAADGSSAYLKLGVSLELSNPEDKAGMQPLMPRVVDQFQSYLRELRLDDLRGSAGVLRLKEELLRRINVAAAPFHVRDVLLKEMIVQ
jgi:flagellar FliL protein